MSLFRRNIVRLAKATPILKTFVQLRHQILEQEEKLREQENRCNELMRYWRDGILSQESFVRLLRQRTMLLSRVALAATRSSFDDRDPASAIIKTSPLTLEEAKEKLRETVPGAYAMWIDACDASKSEYENLSPSSLSVEDNVNAKRFAEYVRPYLQGRVLDIGCGCQPVPLYLNEYPTERIYGIDPVSKTENHPFSFFQGVAEYLPWEDSQFDCVVIGTSLDHILLLDRALAEIRRVMKADAYLIIWTSFVPGAKRYDPYTDPKRTDEWHLFHFDRGWFDGIMTEKFEEVERVEGIVGCHQAFITYRPRILESHAVSR